MARALRCVIASTYIDLKDGACQEACPVECIYEGGWIMYIQPDVSNAARTASPYSA